MFIAFNPRRAARGVGAAKVAFSNENGEQWLWMTKKDIELNISDHGQHPELLRAREAYKNG